MTVRQDLWHAIERRLYARGFAAPFIRQLLATQIILTGAAFVVGLPLALVNLWPLAFAVGAGLATYSLWHIARFVQGCIYQDFSAALGIRLFFGFVARLMIIGIVLFGLIVWLRAPVAPLLLGLGSTVISITLWGLARSFRKTVKEA
ncbi:ATP synthase subunit I [Desulfovibrio sp. OttesenSCG-928-M16]|nr:ATP synthase subunit I [Desulfovibrio sp. OttesenSCG-928-M16]MDL2207592.1 ATP synthase subunit I [Desulfovibrio sp. OttesenSCG-928-M16]